MVVMDHADLLTEVSIFLRVTLEHEQLSEHAETCRQQLIARLSTRECSPPQAYIDMNGGSFCNQKLQHQISDCYEEFDSSFEKNSPCKQHIPEGYVNNLYNNLSSMRKENVYANNQHDLKNYVNIKHQSQYEDNMYINPSSPLANTPVIPKISSPVKNVPSNPNSERNSIISLKKDSDRTSDSSSYTSSSTRCDESPEVLAMSASAVRYAASKFGILGRREKYLFFDHTKTYWVAIVNQTMFMFSNDKDSKPLAELDITGYQARPVALSNNKTDFKFELVKPGQKTFQFTTEKQSDMDKWISAINSAAKVLETPRDWSRQLPSLPAGHDTYDQPDGAPRPVVEAEYELPDAVMRSHTISQANKLSGDSDRRNSAPSKFLHSPQESRQLPLLPHQETYDQPEPTVRPVVTTPPELYESLREELYHCIDDQVKLTNTKETVRRLPSLPQEQETYDQPEPTVRPVNQALLLQEELYSIIDNNNDTDKPVTQEAVYKNVEDNEGTDEDDDCNYYNIVPYPERETDRECIYDVISEQRQILSALPIVSDTKKPPISAKPLITASINDKLKQKTEEKRLSPLVSNMATIFDKPFSKPQLREVKPPFVSKTCQ